MSYHVCPVCEGKGQKQLVSAYVKQNYSTSKEESTSTGGGDIYTRGSYFSKRTGSTSFGSTTKTSSESATSLAQELLPPTKPVEPGKPHRNYLAYYGLVVAFGGILTLTKSPVAGFLVIFLIGLPSVVSLIRFGTKQEAYRHSIALYPTEVDFYEEKREIWEKLYICLQDGIVYSPETGDSTPTEHIDLLYPKQ